MRKKINRFSNQQPIKKNMQKTYFQFVIFSAFLRQTNHRSRSQYFWLRNDGEKWSRTFYFEILLAPSELLLPSTKKSAQKG